MLPVRKLAILLLLSSASTLFAQSNSAVAISDLMALKSKAADSDTRVRVDAFHRAWSIGMSSSDPAVKLSALEVLKEPIGSSSDHIRMPAVYAVVEIANSTTDLNVKVRAIAALAGPLVASQVPIRDVAIDAVNQIAAPGSRPEVVQAAVKALGEPIRSGNNGVRIPAINALVRAVRGCNDDTAYNTALDTLSAPLESNAMIGGMEVRLLAVVAVERIGLDATAPATKAKALGMLKSYAGKSTWEPEAKRRAEEAATAVQRSLVDESPKPSKIPPSQQTA